MIMKPFISIIVPVYNAEKTVERCIESVLRQDFSDFEMILIDDGSSDRSGILCEQYCATDNRIRVIHQHNHGVSYARNVGIDVAKGTYITFLDSDDTYTCSHLETYYQAITKYDCDVVIGGYTRIEQGHAVSCLPKETGCYGGDIWEDICRDTSLYGYLWNKLFRLDLVHSHDLHLCETMYSQEDLDFCLSIFGVAERVALISCDSYQYFYVPGKRLPPFWDFIANQMKMLHIGKTKTELSGDAQACVHKRILSLLYTGLYDAAERPDYNEVVEKIAQIDGLTQLLQNIPAKGEHSLVARNFVLGKYERIRWYFKIRNRIRDVVRAIRKTPS